MNHGANTSPKFSPNGKYLGFLSMKNEGFESDKANLILVHLKQDDQVILTEKWDRSVSSFIFSEDGSDIYLTAQENARIKIFSLHMTLNKNGWISGL